jgi:purine-binding chemotaxis protein CheW
MAKSKQYCTFYVDKYLFGVEVLEVQEVLRYQDLTQVPLAPKEVQGLINLRGQIISAIDLRCRLGLPPREEGIQPMNVVIRTNNEVVSFLVDSIGDVLDVDEDTFEIAPDTVDIAARELVSGVYKLEGQLLMVLDAAKAAILSGLMEGQSVSST